MTKEDVKELLSCSLMILFWIMVIISVLNEETLQAILFMLFILEERLYRLEKKL